MLRKFISTLAVAAVSISAVAGEEKILNIYNWAD